MAELEPTAYADVLTVDAETGAVSTRPLTEAEIVERDALAAEAAVKAEEDAKLEAEQQAARTRLEATDTAALADTAPAKDLTEANAQLAVVRALLVDALVALGVAAPSKTADSAEKG